MLPLDHLKRYCRALPERCHLSIVKEPGGALAATLAFLLDEEDEEEDKDN
jgi:hypothetical protein